MTKSNRLLLPLAFAFLALAFAGCPNTTLAPSGSYTDKNLYLADATIGVAYQTFETFVTFEYQNRALLASHPEIKAAADNIRLHAHDWLASAIALRETYAANPTTDNASKLTAAVAIIQTALTEATKYLVQATPAPKTTTP